MTKIAFPPRAWQCLYSQGVSNSEDVFLASAGCEEAGEFSSLAPPDPSCVPAARPQGWGRRQTGPQNRSSASHCFQDRKQDPGEISEPTSDSLLVSFINQGKQRKTEQNEDRASDPQAPHLHKHPSFPRACFMTVIWPSVVTRSKRTLNLAQSSQVAFDGEETSRP